MSFLYVRFVVRLFFIEFCFVIFTQASDSFICSNMAGENAKNNGENDTASNVNIEPTEDNDEDIIEEYVLLESTLDKLNSALDFLEQKNDDIHQQLKELLQSNIAIRQEMREENKETNNSD